MLPVFFCSQSDRLHLMQKKYWYLYICRLILASAQHNTLLGQLISSKTSLIILHLFHIGRLFVLSFVRSFVSVRSAIQFSSIALFIGYFALSAAFINCIYACLNYIITYTYCASENWNRPQPTMNNVLSVRSNGRSRV